MRTPIPIGLSGNRGRTRPGAGDILVVYGRGDTIDELRQRRTGMAAEREHDSAVGRQRQVEAQERRDRRQSEQRVAARRGESGQDSGR
jgi:hypothetical protein